MDREFNLSTTAQAPAHNLITAGTWTPGAKGEISVEDGIAETLGLKLGDTVGFDVGGVPSEARITSLRKVDWGSMRANFFVIYPVDHLDDVAVSYLAAYRAPDVAGFDNALVREFPNITNVDLSTTLAQVQRVLDQVIRAVEFLFGFTLAAGLVVLFAAVTAFARGARPRVRHHARRRCPGPAAGAGAARRAGRRGPAGGFPGQLCGGAVGWALARWVFEFNWTVPWWAPLAGAVAGALLAWMAGWWALREVLRRPVMDTLRQVAE